MYFNDRLNYVYKYVPMGRRRVKYWFLFVCMLWCLPRLLYAGGVPCALMDVDHNSYTVLVNKSLQKLYVYRGLDRLKTFPCATGKNPGDKVQKGDNRTPEGIYFFRAIINGDHLPKYYGWRAYVLNYPNPVDKIDMRDGDGIWIHGREFPLSTRDTHGCISLANYDLKGLSRYLYRYWTPIVVFDHVTYSTRDDLKKRAAIYKAFVSKWLRTWESKDLKGFRACYSPKFRWASNYTLDKFLERKKRLFRKYSIISIDTDGIRIIDSKKYALAVFLEDFSGDHFRTKGVKFVYITHNGNKPAILAEQFVPINMARKWTTVARHLDTRLERELYAFIDNWRNAWISKDMKTMATFYLDSFPEREHFFKEKAKHLSGYKDITITFENIRSLRDGVYWHVVAKQTFSSDRYSDVGVKKLDLVRKDHRFYIIKERWRRL